MEIEFYCLSCKTVQYEGKIVFKTAFRRQWGKTYPLGVCQHCDKAEAHPLEVIRFA